MRDIAQRWRDLQLLGAVGTLVPLKPPARILGLRAWTIDKPIPPAVLWQRVPMPDLEAGNDA